jgi:ATP phosphoribosyltransferase
MTNPLIFAVPSKGRLMEQTAEVLAKSGVKLRKTGLERGYRGEIDGVANVEVAYVSASEIVQHLKCGKAHFGVTGRDLLEEQILDLSATVEVLKAFEFGPADVVVAVPDCWLDVRVMADLEDSAVAFRRQHGRRLIVATKFRSLTRRWFAQHDITSYRIVESLGATEGAPASGIADLIVDITTTGDTLRANGLRILDDGVILKSTATLVRSKLAPWSATALAAERELRQRLGLAHGS